MITNPNNQTIDSMLNNLNLLKTDLNSNSAKNEFHPEVPVLMTKPKLTTMKKNPNLKIEIEDADIPLFTDPGCFDN